MLASQGHDVVSAVDRGPRTPDAEFLAWALEEERILITEDKDFGEPVFIRRLPHPCIIRFVEMTVEDKVAAMQEIIQLHTEAMSRRDLIVVTPNQLRVRRREEGDT
ncbi:MAG: hypothetical protein TQ37_03950 [Candidatus Synechococcus spongiarum 15L]|uniref:DUF5615 domain-containing protein n=1 Tax=Candidatus Synechococcus spongiarum 15L TaxID=1608419 RepID=A0A0G8AW98_9SYNE|nr:MAG: hypothetical protein TQ37_03950 [Candidatus Synechococcus spongiarum 15L]